MKKKIIISIILILLVSLFFSIRLFSSKEIDDINPEIPCLEKYIEKSDILWVIPKYQNKSIAENKEWCESILKLNKTLGLHGIYHTYEEFKTNRNLGYLQEGINIFEECFGFKPKIFKAPQLEISKQNKKLIKNNNLKLKGKMNQGLHKVYHCNDTGIFSNKFIDFF
jgi:predicted deacetylase